MGQPSATSLKGNSLLGSLLDISVVVLENIVHSGDFPRRAYQALRWMNRNLGLNLHTTAIKGIPDITSDYLGNQVIEQGWESDCGRGCGSGEHVRLERACSHLGACAK